MSRRYLQRDMNGKQDTERWGEITFQVERKDQVSRYDTDELSIQCFWGKISKGAKGWGCGQEGRQGKKIMEVKRLQGKIWNKFWLMWCTTRQLRMADWCVLIFSFKRSFWLPGGECTWGYEDILGRMLFR